MRIVFFFYTRFNTFSNNVDLLEFLNTDNNFTEAVRVQTLNKMFSNSAQITQTELCSFGFVIFIIYFGGKKYF